MTAPLDYATRYWKLGFVWHPVCPVEHGCSSPGKIPFSLEQGQHLAGWQDRQLSKQAPQLSKMRRVPSYSKCGIGCLTGHVSGIAAIDIDGEAGEYAWEEVKEGDVETWEYTTGRGRRLLFRYSVAARTVRPQEGLEILLDGSQTVLPPSRHPTGRLYTWKISPDDLEEPEPLPPWLASKIETSHDWSVRISRPTNEGMRHLTATSIAGYLVQHHLPPEVVQELMLAWGEAKCDPPMTAGEIKRIVMDLQKKEERKSSPKALGKFFGLPPEFIGNF